MNKREKREIALNISVLMTAFLDKNSDTEEVANIAISFCREMLIKFPELRDLVEEMIHDDWDTQIAWINWEKQMLK
jgi:hypothetical protein